jgi:hypothetical protein
MRYRKRILFRGNEGTKAEAKEYYNITRKTRERERERERAREGREKD